MASKSDPPRNISAASHEIVCSVDWLRRCVRRGHVEAEQMPNRHLVFRNKGIQQAKELLYGAAAVKSSKKNGR